MKTLNNKCQHLLHFIAINTQRNIGYAFYTCTIRQYMQNTHWRMVFSNEKDVHNALIPLLKKGYITRVQRGVYMITLLGVQYFGDMFSELCDALQSENTQPEEIEQPKQNEEDFSYVKNMKNYKFLAVKLLDMIISTPEFKNDVFLILTILTDLKNDGWFKETPDGRYPISEEAIKGYTQYMNEEGRAIINEESITSSNGTPCVKANETNYETAMKLCESAMKLCNEAVNMCNKVSHM